MSSHLTAYNQIGMKRLILFFVVGFYALSCSVEPTPISYSNDECKFCMMKIMDERFGAEIVTEKGKIYKFDSAECMLRYSKENPGNPKHVMVTHVNAPNVLQDAKSSYYVICENIPSPMGANLSSYPNMEFATTKVMELGGKTYSWDELLEKFEK